MSLARNLQGWRIVRLSVSLRTRADLLAARWLAPAQEPPPVPSSATEPQGFVPEPDCDHARRRSSPTVISVKATSQTAFIWTTAT